MDRRNLALALSVVVPLVVVSCGREYLSTDAAGGDAGKLADGGPSATDADAIVATPNDAGGPTTGDCGAVDPTTLLVDGLSGNDSNPGTRKCPLATVTEALGRANPASAVTTVTINGVADTPLVYSKEKFPLQPQKALTIKGMNGDLVLRGSGACGAAPCTVQVEVANVTISNLAVENPDANGEGVTATATANGLRLESVQAHNCGGAGVHLLGTPAVTLAELSVIANGRGLVLDTGAVATATVLNVQSNTNEGVLITSGQLTSSGSLISSNKIGVSIGKDGKWVSTTDSIEKSSSHGAVSQACPTDGVAIFSTEDTFNSNGGDGLQMLGCGELSAMSTEFYGNGGSGLLLGASALASLGDAQSGNVGKNLFKANTGAGICNQTVARTVPITMTACFDVFTSSPPTTSASCTDKVDIANASANPIPIATSGGPCQ